MTGTQYMASALHETVRKEILRRVRSGEYTANALLPSATALADEFSVSAITVKRALRDLQVAGVLRAVPGRGTFVQDQKRFIRDLGVSFNSIADAKRLGLNVSVQLCSVSRERISDPAFDMFAAPGLPMLCVRKIIMIDQTALMHDTSFLPFQVDDDLIEQFSTRFVMEALSERGIRFTGTRLLIDAAPASREAQAVFDIPNGYPTLRRLYRLETIDPDIYVLGVAEAPFDRLACTIELKGPGRDTADKALQREPTSHRLHEQKVLP